MRLLIITTGLLFFLSSCTTKQDQHEYVTIPTGDSEWIPNNYICYRTPDPVKVDGSLDDQIWEAVEWTEDFRDIEGDKKPLPRYRTRMKMLWDDTYLYFAAELEEPDIWATLIQRDTVIFYDNDFEVFIDPDGDTHEYYEFEMNAFGTEWDLLLTKPYRDWGHALNAWDIKGIKVGVRIFGTINDPKTKDEKWTLEIAMPWDILKECAPENRRPEAGEQWRMNFSRVEWDIEVKDGRYVKQTDPETGRPLPEHNWVWSPQGLINMHLPELWGYVQFSDAVAGTTTEDFVPEPEEKIKWELRKLYYEQSRYLMANGIYARNVTELGLSGTSGLADLTIYTGTKTFEMSLPSLDPGKHWYIREDGRVWKD